MEIQPSPLPHKGEQRAAVAGRPVAGFVLDCFLAVVLLLLLSLVFGAIWGMGVGLQMAMQGSGKLNAAALMREIGQPSAVVMICMTLVSTGGAALLLYFWRRRASLFERTASFQAARRPGTWGWVILAGFATFLFSALLSGAAQHFFQIAPEPSNAVLIEEILRTHPAFLVVFAVLLAPAYEELLFRRVLFGRLWAAGRPWLGLLLSSAVFALVHEIPGVTHNAWPATLLLWLTYGFMGAVFAAVYWRTRTLWAAYGAHALNNALALAVMKLYGAQ